MRANSCEKGENKLNIQKFVKYILALCAVMLVATSFSACADVKEKAYKAYNKKVIYEIAFIPSDVVLEKGTYENAIWEGLIEYGEESGKAHKYFASDQIERMRATANSVAVLLSLESMRLTLLYSYS